MSAPLHALVEQALAAILPGDPPAIAAAEIPRLERAFREAGDISACLDAVLAAARLEAADLGRVADQLITLAKCGLSEAHLERAAEQAKALAASKGVARRPEAPTAPGLNVSKVKNRPTRG